jgi:hypothetical protein
MLFITLDCGRLVHLDAIDCSLAYAGQYAGLPNAEINAQIIADKLTEPNRPWALCKVHLLPPAVDERDPEHPVLPSVCLRGSLLCVRPIDTVFMASSLVVVWFVEECHAEPIEDVVFRAVRELPWEQLAEDFEW